MWSECSPLQCGSQITFCRLLLLLPISESNIINRTSDQSHLCGDFNDNHELASLCLHSRLSHCGVDWYDVFFSNIGLIMHLLARRLFSATTVHLHWFFSVRRIRRRSCTTAATGAEIAPLLSCFAFPSLQCIVGLFSSVVWTNPCGNMLQAFFPCLELNG